MQTNSPCSLGYIFTGQCRQYILIHCVLRDDVVDGYGLDLSLPPKTRIGLLVQFETPRQAIPDQDVSTRLDVQAVTSGCGVNGLHGYRDVGDALIDLFFCSRSRGV